MLRFKIDERLPKEVAAVLAAHGHDASTVPLLVTSLRDSLLGYFPPVPHCIG
jgi:hypothetical protein